jgi:hypothetical protein
LLRLAPHLLQNQEVRWALIARSLGPLLDVTVSNFAGHKFGAGFATLKYDFFKSKSQIQLLNHLISSVESAFT